MWGCMGYQKLISRTIIHHFFYPSHWGTIFAEPRHTWLVLLSPLFWETPGFVVSGITGYLLHLLGIYAGSGDLISVPHNGIASSFTPEVFLQPFFLSYLSSLPSLLPFFFFLLFCICLPTIVYLSFYYHQTQAMPLWKAHERSVLMEINTLHAFTVSHDWPH